MEKINLHNGGLLEEDEEHIGDDILLRGFEEGDYSEEDEEDEEDDVLDEEDDGILEDRFEDLSDF